MQKLPKAKSLGLNSFYVVLFFMSINCNKVIIDFSDYKVQKCRYWAYSTHLRFFWQKKLFSIFLAVVFKSASIIDKFPYNLITHLPLFFLIFLNSIFMINLKVLKFKYNVLWNTEEAHFLVVSKFRWFDPNKIPLAFNFGIL